MATLCTHCGEPLPREDARYCTNCGTLVPTHPFSPKYTAPPASPADSQDAPRTVLKEQVAQQPSSRSTRRPVQDEPPAWISQLDKETRSRNIPSPETPAPAVPPAQDAHPAARKLHMKVWEPEQADSPATEVEADPSEQKNDVENRPTNPLIMGSPEKSAKTPQPAAPDQSTRGPQPDEVEQVDTVPISTPTRVKPTLEAAGTPAQQRSLQPRGNVPDRAQQAPSPQAPSYARPASQYAQRASNPSFAQPMPERRQVPPTPVVRPLPERRRNRKPLIVIGVLFLFLLAGLIVAWIIVYQPFTVPGITQPQQTFSSEQLGFSLQYPNGWASKVDTGKGTAQFYDSSQTDQVDVTVRPAGGSDLSQYLQREASALKMSNLQTGLQPVTFAGASWQQIKGNIFVRGATYTEIIYATIHHNQLFTIMQMAPQTTYGQEDQLVFSTIRSSFQFLS